MLGILKTFRKFLKLNEEAPKLKNETKDSESAVYIDIADEALNVYKSETQVLTYFNGSEEVVEEITKEQIPVSKNRALQKVSSKIKTQKFERKMF